MDLETSREYASLVGSTIAVCSTFYFWLIRSNRERAQLVAHPVGGLEGTLLMAMDDALTYRRVAPADGEVVLKYWLHLAIVNNSLLPNALLGARIWMKFADGEWREMDVHHEMPDQDLFPTNIDPLTTAGLKLALSCKQPGKIEGGFAERAQAAGDALPRQIPIRIRLKALQDQTFHCEFADDGDGLQRSHVEKVRLAA